MLFHHIHVWGCSKLKADPRIGQEGVPKESFAVGGCWDREIHCSLRDG